VYSKEGKWRKEEIKGRKRKGGFSAKGQGLGTPPVPPLLSCTFFSIYKQ
jgi:hypothetical protein